MATSIDGTRLVTGSADGRVAVWDVTTCQQIRVFKQHSSVVTNLMVIPATVPMYEKAQVGLCLPFLGLVPAGPFPDVGG